MKSKHGAPMMFLEDNIRFDGADCLIWPFGRFTNGYGSVRYKGVSAFAHRVMCILAHGEAPSDAGDAAHSCGNGAGGCVNPQHLSWKSRAGNLADRRDHGTMPEGERHPAAKLSEEQVKDIRSIYARGGVSHVTLGRRYGVGATAIGKIVRGENWPHL